MGRCGMVFKREFNRFETPRRTVIVLKRVEQSHDGRLGHGLEEVRIARKRAKRIVANAVILARPAE
jgi:hypothetical protein